MKVQNKNLNEEKTKNKNEENNSNENKSFIKSNEQEQTKNSVLNKNENKEKQIGFPSDPCPCASLMPGCCTPEFDSFVCDCIAKPFCGACPSENLNAFSSFHDAMLKMAMKDAFNQQDMAQKAKLQVELFQKAQDFAKEVGIQEMKAKQYAKILNEATRKAQIARAMMFQAASQVRLLADKTLRAITPMRCNGPHCGAALTSSPAMTPYTPDLALLNIKQKLNDLGSLTNPVVSSYGSYGYGDYAGMKEGYFRDTSYNGNSRETAYSGGNTFGQSAN